MNINKKLDRMKQWAGERMGGEVRTDTSDDFRALEVEMGLRHEGQAGSSKPLVLQQTLTSCRNGEDAEVHERLRAGYFEADRSARERKEPELAHRIPRVHNGCAWRGLRWRLRIRAVSKRYALPSCWSAGRLTLV